VEFVDNQDCLDLLEGPSSNPNLAVFPLTPAACRRPRATYGGPPPPPPLPFTTCWQTPVVFESTCKA